jgi:methyl-accepting chemotaxis protein
VSVRNYLLAQNPVEEEQAVKVGRNAEAELNSLLKDYGEKLISSDEDRRLWNAFLDLHGRWSAEAEKITTLAGAGRRDAAIDRMFNGTFPDLGVRATNVLEQWVDHNEHLAITAGNSSLTALTNSRRNVLIVIGLVLLISGIGGTVTFRRIVHPIRGLQSSVETIAQGDYAHPVPFTEATDEMGGLARSVEILRHGAAALAEERWVKVNIAKITGALQGAGSHLEFATRLVTGLVPALGGGVAAFYLFESGQGRLSLAEGAFFGIPTWPVRCS